MNAAHAPNILIVSRDGDYGVTQGKVSALNDWLSYEFKSRVRGRRKIQLTTKLTDALKKLDELVTPADEEVESRLIENWKRIDPDVSLRELTTENISLRHLNALQYLSDVDLRELQVGAGDFLYV